MNIDDRLQDEESDDIYEGPSKSQKKREAEALQKLGGELAKLAPDAFERVTGLPEDIRDAILEYRRLKSFGALRRQMQLIGKLMRRLDYDAVREYHRSRGWVCFENYDMGLYFINDPDDYWIEILPLK